jgi:hypothetical protein
MSQHRTQRQLRDASTSRENDIASYSSREIYSPRLAREFHPRRSPFPTANQATHITTTSQLKLTQAIAANSDEGLEPMKATVGHYQQPDSPQRVSSGGLTS